MTISKLSVGALILAGAFGIASPAEAQQMECGVTQPFTAIKHRTWDMNEQLALQTLWMVYMDENGNWLPNHDAYAQTDSPFPNSGTFAGIGAQQQLDPPYMWFNPGTLYTYGWQTVTTAPECSAACETVPGVDFCLATTYGFCLALEYKPGITPSAFTYIPSSPAYSVGGEFSANYGGLGVSTCVPVTPKADLTAGGITPIVAIAGTPTTFAATIANVTANVGASATRFQRATSAAGAGATTITDTATAAINAGSSAVVSASHTFATAGTYYMRACADTAAAVDESNENNNCGAWTAVTVASPPALTDLTAGGITPTSATAGTATSFSATVSNISAASAGASATRFQRATSAAGAGAATISDVATAAIAAGGSIVKSASYTFSSAGTYYVRACADTASAVTESNEGNNCGAWTAVTVAAATPPSVSCTVSPSSITPGQSVTYSANPSGGASTPFTWVASDGASVGTAATVTRTLSAPGTYAMNVRASGTSVSYCPNVSVTADWCTASTPNLTLTATPARVRAGQSSTLTWSATGVNGEDATCTVSGPGVSWTSAVTTSPSCSASGTANTTISTQSTYTLTCAGVSESVTVNVIPNFQEF